MPVGCEEGTHAREVVVVGPGIPRKNLCSARGKCVCCRHEAVPIDGPAVTRHGEGSTDYSLATCDLQAK